MLYKLSSLIFFSNGQCRQFENVYLFIEVFGQSCLHLALTKEQPQELPVFVYFLIAGPLNRGVSRPCFIDLQVPLMIIQILQPRLIFSQCNFNLSESK
jgi:hypothetical protein